MPRSSRGRRATTLSWPSSPSVKPAALDLVVQLGEGDPVVQTVDHQEIDQVGQRVRERFGAPLGIDGHQRVEPGAVLAERRALLVLPAGEDHEAVMAQGRLEQLAQPGPSVDLAPAAHVVPAHPLPVRAAQPRQPQLAGVEPGAEEQERHGTDAHGVVAARHGLPEGAVEVGEGLARAGAGVPAEVPQRDGQFVRQMRRQRHRGLPAVGGSAMRDRFIVRGCQTDCQDVFINNGQRWCGGTSAPFLQPSHEENTSWRAIRNRDARARR